MPLLTRTCFEHKRLDVPVLFYHPKRMAQVDSLQLAHTLLTAPAWARVGLTTPSERLREAAAAELADTIIGALETPQTIYDARQMTLPL